MPRSPSDDEYDSDSGSEISVTDVQLGLADGPLEADDQLNPLVSRIGGRAAWLPMQSPPPRDVSICAQCSEPMQLLVQIFAPLVESPYDRCLLVWGCPRAQCQRTNSASIKVVRTLKHNPRWAVKLEKQRQRREAREKEREQQRKARQEEQERLSKINPFAANANVAAGNLFGGGANPFAAAEPTPAPQQAQEDESGSESDSESESDDEASRLAEELEIKAALSSTPAPASEWASSAPHYPALYLNTIPEPSTSSAAKKLTPSEAKQLKPSEDFNEDELKAWGKEGYEKMMLDGIDDVFERFVKRVGVEGRQVVRYEFGGVPLPFHGRGNVYDRLWPKERKVSAGQGVDLTRAAFRVGAEEGRQFDPSAVPPCPVCKAPRTFEAQLMPNLINTLRPEHIQGDAQETNEDLASLSAEERTRREIELALGRKLPTSSDASAPVLATRTGLTWSTALIFVCSADCCTPLPSGIAGETWAEEWICLQFEDE